MKITLSAETPAKTSSLAISFRFLEYSSKGTCCCGFLSARQRTAGEVFKPTIAVLPAKEVKDAFFLGVYLQDKYKSMAENIVHFKGNYWLNLLSVDVLSVCDWYLPVHSHCYQRRL